MGDIALSRNCSSGRFLVAPNTLYLSEMDDRYANTLRILYTHLGTDGVGIVRRPVEYTTPRSK